MKKEKYRGKVNKITEKYVFLNVNGLKSEPVLDINELKTLGLTKKIKMEKLSQSCLKNLKTNGRSSCVSKQGTKIKGWDKLVEAYEKDEPVRDVLLVNAKEDNCRAY